MDIIVSGTPVFRADVDKQNYYLAASGNLTATGRSNFAAGPGALVNVVDGYHNVAIGKDAASSHQTGTGNVWIGSAAGRLSVDCIDVVHIGWEAGEQQIAGVGDVGVGRRSLGKAPFAANNTCIGDSSGWSLSPILVNPGDMNAGFASGYGNCIMGYVSAEYLTSGRENVIIGGGAAKFRTSGDFNVIIGSQAMSKGTMTNLRPNGDNNIAIGYNALRDYEDSEALAIGALSLFEATGIRNLAIGSSAGSRIKTGAYNIFLGWGAGSGATTPNGVSGVIVIGYNAQASKNNQVVIGTESNDEFVVNGVTFTKDELLRLKALLAT